jgi:hypothetical protein
MSDFRIDKPDTAKGLTAGSNTQVLFNDGGSIAGDAGLTYNKTTDVLTITGGTVNGGATDNATFDSDGDLTFNGTADYLVGPDKYAFRYSLDEDAGLYFNSVTQDIEVKSLTGVSVIGFGVDGHMTIEGVTSTGATGTGRFVFDTSPVLVTPTLGVATATRLGVGVAADATKRLLVQSTDGSSGQVQIYHDNTNGNIFSSSGALVLSAPPTQPLYIGPFNYFSQSNPTSDGSAPLAFWFFQGATSALGAGNFSMFWQSMAKDQSAILSENGLFQDISGDYNNGTHVNIQSTSDHSWAYTAGLHGTNGIGMVIVTDDTNSTNIPLKIYTSSANGSATQNLIDIKAAQKYQDDSVLGAFTGNFINFDNATVNKFKVSSAGNVTAAGTINVTGHTTFEGVTSTGATGTGKIVYDTTPAFSSTIATDGNEQLAYDIVKHTITATDVTNTFASEAWTKTTVEKIASINLNIYDPAASPKTNARSLDVAYFLDGVGLIAINSWADFVAGRVLTWFVVYEK